MDCVVTALQAGCSLLNLLEQVKRDKETVAKFKRHVASLMNGLEYKIQRRYIRYIHAHPGDGWGWLHLAVLIELSSSSTTREKGIAVWALPAPKYGRVDCLGEAASRVNGADKAPAAKLWYNIGLLMKRGETLLVQGGAPISAQDCFVRAIEADRSLPLPWLHLGLLLGPQQATPTNAAVAPRTVTIGDKAYDSRHCLTRGIGQLEAAADSTIIEDHYSLSCAYQALGAQLPNGETLVMNGKTFTKDGLLAAAIQCDLTRREPWEDLLTFVENNGQATVMSPEGNEFFTAADLRSMRAQQVAVSALNQPVSALNQPASERDEFQKRVSVMIHHDVVDESDPFFRNLKSLDECLGASQGTIDAYQKQNVIFQVVSAAWGTLAQNISRHEDDISKLLEIHDWLAAEPPDLPPAPPTPPTTLNPPAPEGCPPAIHPAAAPLSREKLAQSAWGEEILKPYVLQYSPAMFSTLREKGSHGPALKNGWIDSRRVSVEDHTQATKESVWEEIKCLAAALHPHTARLEGYFVAAAGVYIVMEPFDQAGITQAFLHQCGTWQNRVDWSLSLLDAVDFLHQLGFTHNNLCAENIWFRATTAPSKLRLKVGGFNGATTNPTEAQRQKDLLDTLQQLKLLAGQLPGGGTQRFSAELRQALTDYRQWLHSQGACPGLDDVKERLRSIKRIGDTVQLTPNTPSRNSTAVPLSFSQGSRGFGESAIMNELTRRFFDTQGKAASCANSADRLDAELRRLNRVGRGATSITFVGCDGLTDRHLENYLPALSALQDVTIERCPNVSGHSLDMLVGQEDPVLKIRPFTQIEVLSLRDSGGFSDAGLITVFKHSPRLRRVDIGGTSIAAFGGDCALMTLAQLVVDGDIRGLTSFSLRQYNKKCVPDNVLLTVIKAIGPNLTHLNLMYCIPNLLEVLSTSCPKLIALGLAIPPDPSTVCQKWAADHNITLHLGPT